MAEFKSNVVPGKKVPFVHLHLHTEYSLLDGAARLTTGANSPLFDECVRLGMPGVAITDHGNMMAAFPAYQTHKMFKKFLPKDYDFDVIYGNEFYTVDDMKQQESTKRYDYNHLVLLAKSEKGLENLSALTTLSYVEGYYVKPRIDLKTIRKYSEGLVCLSACLAGVIPQYLLHNEYENALSYAKELQDIFGKDDFYIELQDHGIREERMILPKLVDLAKEIGAKVVATNDVHYIKKEDADAHDVMLCIQTGARLSDENRMRFDSQEFYLKSYEEMKELFGGWCDEALTNTIEVLNKCKGVYFKENQIEKLYPTYTPPDNKTPVEYLKELTYAGLKRRYGDPIPQHIIDRAEEELAVINGKGFTSYYLVVWDFINYSRSVDIPIGPGRGSGVGSIVAYAIGITNIEPLKFDLFFERFLNPERNSPPDFDIDICTERRGEVIDYVVNKYGREKVCQILTLGTLKPKNAIRDVARVFDIPLDVVNKTMKTLPNEQKLTIDGALGRKKDAEGKAIPGISEFIEIYNSDPKMREAIDMAQRLEGMPKNISMHAAGVVICNIPVIEACPMLIQKKKDRVDVITQFQKTEVEALGLLKMDFLGLITLTDIHHAIKYIKEDYGIEIDFDKLGVDDAGVYKMISEGDTDFVFQLENGGMREFMTQLQPNNIEDLILGISMYRPGPMDSIPNYLEARRKPSSIVYDHESLKPILEMTSGYFVYQEQVMNAARVMAGYSLGEADLLRRAMGKKKVDVMLQQRSKFIEGAIKNGIDEKIANKTFDTMEKFATYAFNKSHAAAYAHLSYQTAYLKKYYYVELVCAVLNNRIEKADQLLKYINIAKDHGVEVLPADINKSNPLFKVEDGKLRFGLTAIKNIGSQVADEIVSERKQNGEYKSLTDFVERLSQKTANKTTIENCTKAGAMDCFGYSRSTIMANYERIIKNALETKKRNDSNQISFFDEMIQEDTTEKLNEVPEYKKLDLLAMEKEVLNTYMSGHPLEEFKDVISTYAFNLGEIAPLLIDDSSQNEDDENENDVIDEEGEDLRKSLIELYADRNIMFAGIIENYIKKKTKTNAYMGVCKISDKYASIETIFSAKVYERYKDILKNDLVAEVVGTLKINGDKVTLFASRIRPLTIKNENQDKNKAVGRVLYIKPKDGESDEKTLYRIQSIFTIDNNGIDKVAFKNKEGKFKSYGPVTILDSHIMMVQNMFDAHFIKELESK